VLVTQHMRFAISIEQEKYMLSTIFSAVHQRLQQKFVCKDCDANNVNGCERNVDRDLRLAESAVRLARPPKLAIPLAPK